MLYCYDICVVIDVDDILNPIFPLSTPLLFQFFHFCIFPRGFALCFGAWADRTQRCCLRPSGCAPRWQWNHPAASRQTRSLLRRSPPRRASRPDHRSIRDWTTKSRFTTTKSGYVKGITEQLQMFTFINNALTENSMTRFRLSINKNPVPSGTCTALLSPPASASPQVITTPCAVSAAKAPLLATNACSAAPRSRGRTAVLSPPGTSGANRRVDK